ncbi:hypothetical protein [Frigoriglobus tundricola]|uniref:Uncharacterized protein n=1 Tax=Frigoriglobus tundricola TaxID=2774151 RepID=A0A6M5Z414_9BACT|nr:hypothetical protein [Frigoriglobus tundricola]QJX00192.1 hypothetical protein FTUN_7816 [Frigoriglobus tundricola]
MALNTDRLADAGDGKFFRTLMRQWPQGLWVVTPEGKVLGFTYHKPKPGESSSAGQRRWVTDTLTMLRDAAKDAGPLTVREVKTKPGTMLDRGRGPSGDGGARLAVSVMGLRNGQQDGPPVVDSVRLDKEDWATFAPPAGAKVGTDWTVPEAVARQFTPALSPLTDPIFGPRPAHATTARITASLARVGETVIVVRYAGRWATDHNRDGDGRFPIHTTATGEGVGVFDAKTGKPLSVMWVLNGTYRAGPATEKPRATGAVLEWVTGP